MIIININCLELSKLQIEQTGIRTCILRCWGPTMPPHSPDMSSLQARRCQEELNKHHDYLGRHSPDWTDWVLLELKEGNLLGRIITQKHYLLSEQRAFLLRTATAQYRYELLLKNHPNIEQQITQNHIASYLGISRETLSRIRRKKLKCVKWHRNC